MGDIVALDRPGYELVKRVIGLPGDRLEPRDEAGAAQRHADRRAVPAPTTIPSGQIGFIGGARLGDVVALDRPPGVASPEDELAKRVIGLPVDRLEARDGAGAAQQRADLHPGCSGNTAGLAPVTVPSGQRWLIGGARLGDVVVLDRPPGVASPEDELVKRAIGLPVDRPEAREGRVLHNGAPIADLHPGCGDNAAGLAPTTVASGHRWLIGGATGRRGGTWTGRRT